MKNLNGQSKNKINFAEERSERDEGKSVTSPRSARRSLKMAILGLKRRPQRPQKKGLSTEFCALFGKINVVGRGYTHLAKKSIFGFRA